MTNNIALVYLLRVDSYMCSDAYNQHTSHLSAYSHIYQVRSFYHLNMTSDYSTVSKSCVSTLTKVCLLLSLTGLLPLYLYTRIFEIKVFSLPKYIPQYVRSSSEETTHQCSSSIIKDYIRTHDFFPELGTWIINNNTPISWSPELCHFNASRLQKNILRCVKLKEWYSFLIIGDSNGLRYADALVQLLSSGHKNACKTTKREGGDSFTPDIKYFKTRDQIQERDFRFHHRDCGGCKSLRRECLFDGIKITVEHIAMEFVLDTEITTYRGFHNPEACKPGQQCFQSNTYQEMIFSEYLQRQYPDVIMLFQNSHDRMRKSLGVFDVNINYLVKLVENIVPQNTTVVWLSELEEYPPKKNVIWGNLTLEGGFNDSEHIHEFNKRLFGAIKPIVGKPNNNMHGFFDLQKLSHTILPYWSLDGMHFDSSWYALTIRYIMQILCV